MDRPTQLLDFPIQSCRLQAHAARMPGNDAQLDGLYESLPSLTPRGLHYRPRRSEFEEVRIHAFDRKRGITTIQAMPHATVPNSQREHIAIYAGSFDPITLGHLDVLRRARNLFDSIVLAIGRNPEKPSLFTPDERQQMAEILVSEMLRNEPEGCPVRVERYSGLTVDFARNVKAVAILRGIRNITDLAGECQLAITNRQVADIETVFIVTGETYAFTSSSLIRQVAALGGPLDRLKTIVPQIVIDRLKLMRQDPKDPLGRLAHDQLVE
jgi:pantetheine-phosphate adenylyltransferase